MKHVNNRGLSKQKVFLYIWKLFILGVLQIKTCYKTRLAPVCDYRLYSELRTTKIVLNERS